MEYAGGGVGLRAGGAERSQGEDKGEDGRAYGLTVFHHAGRYLVFRVILRGRPLRSGGGVSPRPGARAVRRLDAQASP